MALEDIVIELRKLRGQLVLLGEQRTQKATTLLWQAIEEIKKL